MINRIYIEESIRDHPRTKRICSRFSRAQTIPCTHYKEVFNRKSQNFRLQKQQPALILARKEDSFVLEPPDYCKLGDRFEYYYFSHMLNCIYDCTYCFLQGLYDSANYVLFVNYDDFLDAIEETVQQSSNELYFFSGHVNDSLVLDQVTGFSSFFLPRFRALENARVELRTKSTQIQTLLEMEALDRCVVAWSFTPADISSSLEHGVPPVDERLEAIQQLQEQNWNIGLRFDPVIYCDNYPSLYRSLFEKVFSVVQPERLHSVTLGPFRLPESMLKTMSRQNPEEPLFAGPLENNNGLVSYRDDLEREMLSFCEKQIRSRVPEDRFFPAVE